MRLTLFIFLLLPILLPAQQYQYINGLQFPSNGDDPGNKHIAIQFLNPQNDGLPIWGKEHAGTTWIWEIYPFQQTGYYTTFFWADNGDNWHEAYYGCHPFPIPPSAGSGTSHYWELAGMANGRDNTKTRSGEPLLVVKERWYKQALRIHVNPDGSKRGIFYIDLPDTSNAVVIDVTSDPGWGETNPPNPVVVFGSAPWANSERLSGILGRIKIFNKELNGPDIIKEVSDMNRLVTSAGRNNIWWGITSFENVDDLSSDYGTGRSFEWANTYKATVVKIDSLLLDPGDKAPEVLNIPEQIIPEGKHFTAIVLDDFVTDPDDADNTLFWEITGNFHLDVKINPERILTVTAPDSEWNGSERLHFKVSDPQGLSDTTSTWFTVQPVNDPPQIIGMPKVISFSNDSSVVMMMSEYAHDVDSADSLLFWSFTVSNDSLIYSYDPISTELHLTAPAFSGEVNLYCTLIDEGGLEASDTISVSITPITAISRNRIRLLPNRYELRQNYPNPFNPITYIEYGLPHKGRVRILLYNILGEKVAKLIDTIKPAGYHVFRFDASGYSSGIYIYQLQIENVMKKRKMLKIK